MYCRNCQAQLKPGAKFCTKCGTLIPVEEPVVPVEPVVPAAEPVTPVQPPVEPTQSIAYHQQTAVADPPAPKAVKKGPTALMRALSVVLCVFLFFTAAGSLTIFQVRGMLTEDAIAEIVADIELDQLMAADFMQDVDDDVTLVEYICAEAASQSTEDLGITNKKVKKFIEESTFLDFATEKLNDFVGDLIDGTNEASISKKELKKLLQENAAVMDQELGLAIADIDGTVDTIMTYGVEGLDSDFLRSELGIVYTLASVGLSYWTAIGLLVATMLLILAVFALNKWLVGASLRKVGTSITVLGVLAALIPLLAGLISNAIFGEGIGQIVTAVLGGGLFTGLIVLALGVVLLVGGILLGILEKKETA